MDTSISVVIPVYNVEKYLTTCVESIITNPYSNMEVILVNDGSTDKSGAICDEYKKEYPDLIKVIHKENGGLSDARNKGTQSASGEYIFFVDSDDTVKINTVSLLAKKLQEFNFPDMLCFDYIRCFEDGTTAPGQTYNPPALNKILDASTAPSILTQMHSASTRITKKSVITSNNLYFPKGLLYEDLCTVPKIIINCKSVVFIEDVLYNYLQRGGSIMHTKNFDDFNDNFTVIDELITWFKSKEIYDKYYDELCYYTFSYLLYSTSINILKHQSYAPILNKLVAYTNTKFPKWSNNKYLKEASTKKRVTLFLLKKRLYFVPFLLWKLKPKT